jgi:hypothetical protein
MFVAAGNTFMGGTLSVSGNANIGNIGTGGLITATGNITGGNLLFGSGVVSGTGNITGGNLLFGSGVVSGTGNISAGNVTTTGYHLRSVGTGISAAGTTQGTGTALTKEINVVSTVTSGANAVVLPTAVAGMVLTITNTSANALLVYPAASGIINSLAANASYSQPSGATLQFIAPTTTQWYTVGATYI